ncbi:fluoride efflux transporter FluC [Staphylococcus argensis]|uniref:Fluoride-specific ion channel FluC n=1 Tax=Staphylococcus argensis TaxID=1607738 RepID=A0A2K4FGA6_9STAP|nr:CrcB family protein [Staphylococcus argensis]MCY6990773.1 CrcB family protein [Staphylococcus argensis]POA10276.1 camphor resistance protein CrcB [Staphylococcus argensis]
MNLILVLIGGGCGALVRGLLTDYCNQRFKQSYPIATIIVNIVASFLIAFVSGYSLQAQWLSPLFTIGFLGGLTTFSTLSSELTNFIQARQIGHFIIYSVIQYLGAFLACLLGYYI